MGTLTRPPVRTYAVGLRNPKALFLSFHLNSLQKANLIQGPTLLKQYDTRLTRVSQHRNVNKVKPINERNLDAVVPSPNLGVF